MATSNEIMLPNGMVVNRNTVIVTYGILLALKEIQKYKFWEIVNICRNPNYHNLLEDTKAEFVDKGLLNSDGTPKASIQNIILYLARGEANNLDLIPLDEVFVLFKEVDGQDIE